jgi:hypothetical protein
MEGVPGGALHFILPTMSATIARQNRWTPAKLVTPIASRNRRPPPSTEPEA